MSVIAPPIEPALVEPTPPPATPLAPDVDARFERLLEIEGKAEIVDGRIVVMSPTQPWPGEVAAEIYSSLRAYVRLTKRGRAVTDNQTFRVQLPHRQSLSPDVAYHIGGRIPKQHYEGAPVFAVEVRSFGDHGPRAERLLEEKRDDYFACGTLVVWDVDLQSRDVIRCYCATAPMPPVIFRQGDIAQAEPAVPGWRVSVAEVLPDDWEPPASAAASK